jgi:hypothetical protein
MKPFDEMVKKIVEEKDKWPPGVVPSEVVTPINMHEHKKSN